MKRLLCIILSLTLCLTLLPATVQVQAAYANGLSYEIVDGQATITDCNTSFSGSLTIPDTIDGYPVTCIGVSAFLWCVSLTSVTIPDSVTSIGDMAFYNCTSLASVMIPDSVTIIGSYAFYGCRLTSVTIPDSVTSIDTYAFYDCSSLTGVTMGNSVTYIQLGVFSGCTSLTSVTIPDSVTNIGSGAFSGCTRLTSIYFAGNAPSITDEAFDRVSAAAYYHAGTSGWVNAAPERWTGFNGRITLRKIDHIWFSYTYDNNHTCTVDGTERAVCLTCGETDIRRVEGTADHWFSYTSNNDATCTQDGTKTGKCIFCGIAETVTDEGSAGHAYSDYVSNNDATCTANGTKSSTCANCGDRKTITDEGSALGHSFTNYIFDDNYTCTVDGTETAKCDRCDQTHWRVVPGTADHRYADGTCIFCDQPDPCPDRAGLTGKLTLSGKGAVQLTLAPVGETTPAATQTTTDGSYRFQVAPGDYILTVSQEGAVTRTYTLTLTEGETALDVKLQQQGDVTGDGKVNIMDVAKLYAHIKGTPITDEYSLTCGDTTGDGKYNIMDVAKLYAHIKAK